jgi:hypothetical protein
MHNSCLSNVDGIIHMPIKNVSDLIVFQKKKNDKFAHMFNHLGDYMGK